MIKEYFQDITPLDDASRRPIKVNSPVREQKMSTQPLQETGFDEEGEVNVPAPGRSIRDIDAPERRLRSSRPTVSDSRDLSNFGIQQLPPKPKRPRTFSWWPWIVALILVVILGALALFAFRKTTITIIPHSHNIVFDQTAQFTAYPASVSTTGEISYTLVTASLQASQSVSAQGSQDVETKAQGTITVYNDYSTSPVKLIANTRFETPAGLIFRIPDAVSVPGKRDSIPGQASVTVFADKPGQQYNIGATSRFAIPGLQSTPAMFSNIYGQSTASTSGGFSGQQAAVDPTTLSSTVASLRSQLAMEARDAASVQNGTSTIVFPGLIEITYQDLRETPAASGSVQVNEVAQIQTPVFDLNSFTQTLAQSAGEESGGSMLSFIPGSGFAAQGISEASSTLGTDSFSFQLSGTGTLVWQIAAASLAQALAGHDQSAFEAIIASYKGIQSAHARIEPFWKTTFPSDPNAINVVVEQPSVAQ